jgi:predicted transposase/invertase (TIGR01784 family)
MQKTKHALWLRNKIYLFLLFTLMTCVQASDDPAPLLVADSLSSQSSVSHKRPALEEAPEPRPLKQQVFARPTYDAAAKYLLADPEIRLDFIQTFTGINDITESEPLDNSLNPLRALTNARDLFSNQNYQRFTSWVKANPEKFEVYEGKEKRSTGSELLHKLAACFDDMAQAFPRERDSKLDIICRLKNQDLILVEIQVAKQDFWDERALAYAARIYGGQLRAGTKWTDLKKVIAINILGGGPKKVAYWKDQKQPRRHYIFQDKYDPKHVIPSLQLIQYSLGDTDLSAKGELSQNKRLYDWIEYLRDAQEKDEAPKDIHPTLKRAYDIIRFNALPLETKKEYEGERHLFEDFTEYNALVMEKTREEGKAEGRAEGAKEALLTTARLLIAEGMTLQKISQLTRLTQEDLAALIELSKKTEEEREG